jgi:hypothetical protein
MVSGQHSEWYIYAGPYTNPEQCELACHPPPPPPETKYWCMRKQSNGSLVCMADPLGAATYSLPDYDTVAGPFSSQLDCSNNCNPPPPPVMRFWCFESSTGGDLHCEEHQLLYAPNGSVINPISVGNIVRSGPYATKANCERVCRPPAPPPPPPIPITILYSWYCVTMPGGARSCMQSSSPNGQPPVFSHPGMIPVGGPYTRQEDCLAACEIPVPPPTEPPPPVPMPTPEPKWICVCQDVGNQTECMTQGDFIPAGWYQCAGPYDTLEECQQYCALPVQQDKWWCKSDGTCVLSEHNPVGGVSGPYSSESECRQHCKKSGGIQPEPCPPPPVCCPPTPCPPPQVFVYPSGGGIRVEPEPDEEEKKRKECEKKRCEELNKWRAWITCEDICYVTPGGAPPRDTTDRMLCETESLAAAIACCPNLECPKVEAEQGCEPGFGGATFGSIEARIGQPEAGCPGPPSYLNPWDSLEACNDIDNRLGIIRPPTECEIAKMLGIVGADGKPILPDWARELNWLIQAIVRTGNGFFGNILCKVEAFVKSIAGGDRCSGQAQYGLDIKHGLFTWLERIAGVDLRRYLSPITYEQNYLCPSQLPSAGDSTQAWLRGVITDDQWTCWTKANGYLRNPAVKMREAARTRHTTDDMVRLWLRKTITDEDFDGRLRTVGWTEGQDYKEIRELSKQYPPYSDIIRLMVRDAADETIVDWPDSDKSWQQKYTAKLRDWGEFAGIPDDVTKLLWRAHWSIPSPTQLYEVWYRNRKRGDTIAGTEIGKSITDALQQQDILPRWIPQLVNNSYRLPGRIDIRRSYQIGVMNREAVDKALIKTGYDDESAAILTEYTVRSARLSLRLHSAVRSYMEFGVNYAQAEEELLDYGAARDDITWVLDWAVKRMRAKSRAKCKTSICSQYKTGGIDRDKAYEMLHNTGMDLDQATIAIEMCDCEAAASSPHAAAGTLCKWYTIGIIDQAEFLKRLRTLGWSAEDSIFLIAECQERITDKLRQRAERLSSKIAADERKKAAAEERKRKEAERLARQLAGAAAVAVSRREQREKLVAKAASEIANKCKLPPSSALLLARDGMQRSRDLGSSLGESTVAVVRAASDLTTDSCADFLVLVEQYSQGQELIGEVNGMQ